MEEFNKNNQNYQFEPFEPGEFTHSTPSEQPPAKKKDRKHLKIAALLVAVALVAGIGGSLLTSLISGVTARNEQAQKPQSGAQDTQQAAEDAYELIAVPLPDELPTLNGSKTLTPAQVYAMNVGAVVGIRSQSRTNVFGQETSISSSGTGFVLTQDGYVVTNYHVVNGAQSVSVAAYDGMEYEAEFIGGDEMNDVALLKIDASGLQHVAVADMEQVVVGEEVIAIGNPLGELTFTMTQGYISAMDREINTDGTPINMLQTDAAINSGNSGGPLFDMNGNVVGVTTAKYSGSTASGTSIEGIGFAIPINDVLRIVYDLQQHGYVTGRAYFGIGVKDLDTNTASVYNLPVGPYVLYVNEGSCAEKAGMQQGDIILAVGEQKVRDRAELLSEISDYRAGDTVTVTVYRAGAEVDLNVTFDERPSEDQLAQEESERQQQEQSQQEQTQQQQQFLFPDFAIPGFSFGFDFGN